MNLIFSADLNWGIGLDNKLLYRVKADMAFFKSKTSGNIVVMGHNTLLSLPKSQPLPDRVNFVLSRTHSLDIPNAYTCQSIDQLLDLVEPFQSDQVFVIGGENIYRQLLPYCDTAYVTKFLAQTQADTFMVNLDHQCDWEITQQSEIMQENAIKFQFITYSRVQPSES